MRTGADRAKCSPPYCMSLPKKKAVAQGGQGQCGRADGAGDAFSGVQYPNAGRIQGWKDRCQIGGLPVKGGGRRNGGGRKIKAVIAGGVAGGASVAARLRRLDEHAQVIMMERGGYVSCLYAHCSLQAAHPLPQHSVIRKGYLHSACVLQPGQVRPEGAAHQHILLEVHLHGKGRKQPLQNLLEAPGLQA